MRDSKGRFSKAEARPFKVGDRVRSITHIYNIQGMMGEIREVREDGCCFVHFGDPDDWEPGRSHWPDQMELVEPAPQPKAEDPILAKLREAFRVPGASMHELVTLASQARDARDTHRQLLGLGEDDGTLTCAIMEKLAEIAALKAEVERLKSENDASQARFDADLEAGRADLQAKLDDIKAIMRKFKIMDTLKGDASFTDAVESVLDGEV